MESLLLPQAVIDLLPVAVYVCSAPSGHIVQFNRTAVEMWGRAPELNCDSDRYCGSVRLLSLQGVQLSHEKSPILWVLETGVPIRGFEGMIERADGSRIRVLVNIDPIRDGSDRLIGAISVFQDITKRAETEKALRNSESHLQHFINSGLFGVVYWRMDARGGCITDANDVFATLTGYTPRELKSGELRVGGDHGSERQ